MTNEEFMDEFLATIVAVAEFKPGDKVKWLHPESDSEMMYGEVANIGASRGYTAVVHAGRYIAVRTGDLHMDWSTYLVTDDPIVVQPEKKGYEPDGFNREAFDDFMRNL